MRARSLVTMRNAATLLISQNYQSSTEDIAADFSATVRFLTELQKSLGKMPAAKDIAQLLMVMEAVSHQFRLKTESLKIEPPREAATLEDKNDSDQR